MRTSRRVFPTSATTFTAYLQVIAFGLKGMEFEQNAHEVMAYVADLRNDFLPLRVDFELVGKHLVNAQTKYVDSEKRFDKFDGKLERASEHEALDAPRSPLRSWKRSTPPDVYCTSRGDAAPPFTVESR